MIEISWLDSALADLVKVRNFLKNKNPQAAKRAADSIKSAVNKLHEFPLLGKPVENLIDYRDVYVEFGGSGYFIRYRILKDNIYIVHINHSKED